MPTGGSGVAAGRFAASVDTYKRRRAHATAMHALALEGPDPEALRDRLVEGLAHRGPVATVDASGSVTAPLDGVRTAVTLDDGRYAAAGPAADLDDVLESLAPDHRLALVVGAGETTLPRVVVGDADDPDALVAAPALDALDPAAVDGALEAVEPLETLASLVERVREAEDAGRGGAIATFTGRVRARDAPEDVETTALEFEKYEGVAEARLATIEAELEARDGVLAVELYHRTGVVEAGGDVVHVVALAGHRAEAFAAASDGIDRLKAEVPLFKKEITVEDAFWVHERP